MINTARCQKWKIILNTEILTHFSCITPLNDAYTHILTTLLPRAEWKICVVPRRRRTAPTHNGVVWCGAYRRLEAHVIESVIISIIAHTQGYNHHYHQLDYHSSIRQSLYPSISPSIHLSTHHHYPLPAPCIDTNTPAEWDRATCRWVLLSHHIIINMLLYFGISII